MISCKRCGGKNITGGTFCSKKCRKLWIREHNIKGGKKRAARMYERFLMSFGSDFSNETDCQNSY
jgi:hypothetical protein